MAKLMAGIEKRLGTGASNGYTAGGMLLAAVTIVGCLLGIPWLASTGLITSVVRCSLPSLPRRPALWQCYDICNAADGCRCVACRRIPEQRWLLRRPHWLRPGLQLCLR